MSHDRGAAPTPPGWRGWLFDVVVALALSALSLSIFFSIAGRRDQADLVLPAVLLLAHSGALVWRRRTPLVALGVNLVTALAVHALGYPLVVLGVASLVALYTVASLRERARSLPALVVTTVLMVLSVVLREGNGDPSTVAGNAVVLLVIWFLGDSHRAGREYVSQLEERTRELEAAREDLARTAVAAERLHIARELHDVMAHSMGMIAVQAGVGAHVIESRPDEAKRSLQRIEEASKSALSEIRRMLGLLRAGDEQARTDPSPGMLDLTTLVDEVGGAGLEVDLRVADRSEALSVGVELTIFRIVQEALTNVVKHASAENVRVSVWFEEGAARIEVIDDGAGRSKMKAEGHGIVGMRERVVMHGGAFEAAPLPEKGFRVAAMIPLSETS